MGVFSDIGIGAIFICVYIGGIAIAAREFKRAWAAQGFAFA